MAGRAPLAGIRVADFTWVWAGPFCTLQLAHLGAEVIRVETATRACVTRLLPPFADFEPAPNRSGYFNQYNQGKKSVALDLKRPEAMEAAKRLCAASDIVVENFAAGVMERMGLGWDALRALRADLIMIALSGYGATGPDADKVSYGPAQVPLSGMSSVTGYRGFPPMHVGISYGDPTGGLHGAVAVLAALLHRARTGEGRWVAIAVEDDAAWARLAAAIGHPELASDPRYATAAARKQREDALEEVVSAWTSTRAPEEATATLQAAGVAAFTAATNRDLADDPHLKARGFFVELPHPVVGTRKHVGVPWRMSESDCRVRGAAPCLGADTEQVLRDVCGYGAAEITRLREARALV